MDQILDHVLLPCLRRGGLPLGCAEGLSFQCTQPERRRDTTDPEHQPLCAGKRQHFGQHPCNSAQTFPNQLGLDVRLHQQGLHRELQPGEGLSLDLLPWAEHRRGPHISMTLFGVLPPCLQQQSKYLHYLFLVCIQPSSEEAFAPQSLHMYP